MVPPLEAFSHHLSWSQNPWWSSLHGDGEPLYQGFDWVEKTGAPGQHNGRPLGFASISKYLESSSPQQEGTCRLILGISARKGLCSARPKLRNYAKLYWERGPCYFSNPLGWNIGLTRMQTETANMEEERAPLSIGDNPRAAKVGQTVANQESNLEARPSKRPKEGK